MNIKLENKITLIQKTKKSSSEIFKNFEIGEQIELQCHLESRNMIAGRTMKIDILKDGLKLGSNKVAQLSNNLGDYVLLIEKGLDKFNYESVSKYGALDMDLIAKVLVKDNKKKTVANFFKDLAPGDEFTIVLPLCQTGIPLLTIIGEKGITKITPSRLRKSLECFELEQIEYK